MVNIEVMIVKIIMELLYYSINNFEHKYHLAKSLQVQICRYNSSSNENKVSIEIIQFISFLFICRVKSYKANYRHSTVQIYITS
jgi:hypothetical protein